MFNLICLRLELRQKLDEEAEKQRLQDMDEDEYDALSDEQKAEIDKKRLEIKRERRKRSVAPPTTYPIGQ